MSPVLKLALVVVLSIFLLYVWFSCNSFVYDKADLQQLIDVDFPRTIIYTGNTDLSVISYPVIMKPGLKDGHSSGVKKINNVDEAVEYVKNFDWSYGDKIMIQDLCEGDKDISALYYRDPISNTGYIKALVQARCSKKDSEGKCLRIDRSAIKFDYIDVTEELLTEENSRVFTGILSRIPNLSAARMDLVYKNIDEFKIGKGFCVVEVNGRQGYDMRCRVKNNKMTPLLWIQWILMRLGLGYSNILLGKGHDLGSFIDQAPLHLYVGIKDMNTDRLLTEGKLII